MTGSWVRVIKVGGSLLECQRLPRLLAAWLPPVDEDHRGEAGSSDRPRIDILIAGGGALVDQVRQLDQRFALDAETSHWMSVSAMSGTSRLLASLLKAGQPVSCWDDLQAVVAGETSGRSVFDVRHWLAAVEAEQPGVPLTRDWRTTSDSIAARLAWLLQADELVLLKSTDLAAGMNWRRAAKEGLVDEHFPLVAAELPCVLWVNLRDFKVIP